MSDPNHSDNEPTIQLPKLPQVDEFDPEKTVVVEDWSQVPLPTAATENCRA
jgi:hypothetical protein